MTDKTTRGRASKVDLLPPNIKTQLAMMLRDKQFSQAQLRIGRKLSIKPYRVKPLC